MSITPPPPPPPGDEHPEILDSATGTSLPADAEGGDRRSGRRKGLLVAGGVLALAVVGGGAWAATSFFATGDQPAQALPANALGYVSIDLDPSGAQKIEAVRTLNKFPAFKDEVGVNPDTDVRKAIFGKALDGEDCSVDYDDDIAPWLGDRAALAAVPGSGDDSPQPVVVVQVSDADAAEKGLQALKSCGGDGDQDTAWVIDGDWALVAPTKAVAQAASKAAADSSLADDADFQKWTGEAGDPGIVTMYAAPGAGQAIIDQLGDELGDQAPAGVGSQLTDFRGLAATIRFTDGSLELQGAGQVPDDAAGALSGGGDVAGTVAGLPDDTAAVLGLSLGKGWFDQSLEAFSAQLGGSGDDLVAQLEQATGLSLPEDVETLTSGGLVLAVGPDLDPEALVNSADPSAVPVALKLTGDPDEIESVITKLQSVVPEGASLLGTSADGKTVVVGPDADFRDELTQDGGLGDSDAFTSVVADGDSPGVLYVNVNAFDKAVDSLAGGDQQVVDNIKPLRAIGASTTLDGDISRFSLKISTD